MKIINLESKKITVIFFLFLALLTVLLYWSNLTAYFASDDFDWINSSINRNPLTFFITNFAGQIGSGNYGPIINLIYYFSYSIGGLNPLPYHLFSLFFHLGNILLIYFLARQFFSQKSALLASLFFAVYFNNAEAVDWVAAIPHVSATFFYLLAIILWLKFLAVKKWHLYLISLISFLAALFCKEIAISLPAIMIILFFVKRPIKDYKKLLVYILPFLVTFYGYLQLRLYTTGVLVGYYGKKNLTFEPKRLVKNVLEFLSAFVSSGDFRIYLFHLIENRALFISIGLAVLVLIIIILGRKKLLPLICWALIFGCISFPYLNLRLNPLSNEGERYLYLPQIVVFVALGNLAWWLFKKWRLALSLGLLVVIITSSFILYQKNQVWVLGSKIAQKIIVDFGQIVDTTKQQGVVFLYLPDNINGAQIFRNAIREAINFNYPTYRLSAIVLPIYVRLTPQNWQNHMFDWANHGQGKILGQAVDNKKIILGFDRRESDDYIFELWGYDYQYYITNKIYFAPKPILADSMKKDKIYFLYYDQGGLKQLDTSVFQL
ncbi:MAG: glycosyltransferase family 39 protein [Patescibacteria group bacterium]